MRQIVLDTETTGMDPAEGHRVIELGCLELVNRRFTQHDFHRYFNPNRAIDAGALAVHGISGEFLATQPPFEACIEDFLDYIKGAQLIIHNAAFDTGFLNHELQLVSQHYGKMTDYCTVIDTLSLARQLHPGQRNSLDALCKRYSVNNSHRKLHGALIDAELLGLVYLSMTGGQVSLFSDEWLATPDNLPTSHATNTSRKRKPLRVIRATPEELAAHEARLKAINPE